MKQIMWKAMAALCAMMVVASCGRNLYDVEEAQKIYNLTNPVDTIEANHPWLLTASKVLMVTPPDDMTTERILVLTQNPHESGDAEVVGAAFVGSGNQTAVNITYPSTTHTLYVAAVDAEDKYTIVKYDVSSSSSVINFRNAIVVNEPISYVPQPKLYTYCYEDEFYFAGDFDYNDIVLRISQERTGEKEVRYHVQLAAVGTSKQVAAGIRLVGTSFDNVESVKTVDDKSFNVTAKGEAFPEQMMIVQKETDNLLKAMTGDAVINLFVDAHWATGDAMSTEYGMMQRKKYNVTKGTDATHQMMVPREIVYIVTFKDAASANALSLGQIDPFIYTEFNGAILETHTYTYRTVQALNSYPPSEIKSLPWAFAIPYGAFRWPIDGSTIGFYIKGSNFGAYKEPGYSFGEWSMDHTKALDWYLYPTENQVF